MSSTSRGGRGGKRRLDQLRAAKARLEQLKAAVRHPIFLFLIVDSYFYS